MKQHLTHPLSAAVMVLLLHATASAQSEYQEFFSAPSGDSLTGFFFYKTPDGGGYVSQSGSLPNANERLLMRVDAAGTPQWNKRIAYLSDPTYPIAGSLATTPDNGIVLWTAPNMFWLPPDSFATRRTGIKVNAQGQIEWARSYVGPEAHGAPGYYSPAELIALPDGSSVTASLWDDNDLFATDLYVMKVDASGIVQWSMVHTFPGPSALDQPSMRLAAQPDGSILVTINEIGPGNEAIRIVRISPTGQLLWEKKYVMNNSNWSVFLEGCAVHSTGKFVLCGDRTSGSLSYSFLMWFSADGELYKHRFDDAWNYIGVRKWADDGIWVMDRLLLDSSGTSVLKRLALEPPGVIGNIDHQFWPYWLTTDDDSTWIGGIYQTTDQTFGYVERKPFLMRSALDPLNGCRLHDLGGFLINYIDVPDSLLDITTDTQYTSGNITNADTAVVLIDLPLPTTYDFCTLVGVEESQAATDNISLWPDPLEQGTLLNVQATAPSDLAIFDTRGRAVLQANDQRLSRQVSTAGLAPGTYWATGNDQRGARLWSRAFVVL